MRTGDFSSSKYIKQSDITKPVLWTIDRYRKENVAKESEEARWKCIIYFKECEKGMVFNKTNLNRAEKAFGTDDLDQWIGKKLVVFVDPDVEMGGEIVGGLRVRGAKQAKPEPKPETLDDDMPF